MPRIFKYLIFLIAGFVGLFVVAAVALSLFFEPNDFREEISSAVKEKTGRELLIEGDISLSLFPWLAVEVGKTSLGDAPGFGDQPIASFDSAKFSVRLLPVLLRQDVIVGAADINSLQLNLKIDSRSNSNWSDLIPDTADADVSDAAEDMRSNIDINRIDIADATITYTNAESGEAYVADRVNLHIGRLKDDGSPVPVDGSLHFDLQPAGLGGDLQIATVLAFDADAGLLILDDFNLEGIIEGVASIATQMAVSTDRVEVSTGKSEVSMQPIDLTMMNIHMTADVQPFSYADRVTPQATIVVDAFSPRSMMALFDVEPPLTADPDVLTSVAVEGKARLTTSAVELSELVLKLDDSTFTGALSVPRIPTGAYEFDLVGDSIELSRYMEPADESSTTADTESVAVEIPSDLIRPLNARGELKITTATLGDIVFENIDFGLNVSDGRMRLFPVSADLFGGAYNGDVKIDVSGAAPKLSVNEKIAGVNLASLAKAMFDQDNVTGTVDGAFALTGSGNDTAQIQRSLAGKMSFNLQNGTYEGTDIWYELRRARAQLKGEEPPELKLPATTEFSAIRASGVVTDGVMRNNDLFAGLPHMQLTGSGTVDLAEATVNYNLSARVLERPELLDDVSAEELDEFTEAVIPLRITGPLASPSIKPDIEKLLRQRVKQEVEEEIKDKLEDKLKDLFKR